MSRDPWMQQLRIGWANADNRLVEEALAGGVPVDALQHAGSALLGIDRSDGLVAIARLLIEALGDRRWLGDAELIGELKHYIDDTTVDLTPLRVALDELGDALDQASGSSAVFDVATGVLWPAELLEIGEGPRDVDPASDHWVLVHGQGSRVAHAAMRRFVETIEEPSLAEHLEDTLVGPGAFRRFQTTLSRHEAEYTRWHRFRDDARLGRARAWLTDGGYYSSP